MRWKVIGALVVMIGLGGCGMGPLFVNLSASGYSITRYQNYAPVVVRNVHNPSTYALTRVVVTADCYEDQYESLDMDFASSEFSIGAGETISSVTLQHVDGWPYFTDFKVYCSFNASNRAFPMEPEVDLLLD